MAAELHCFRVALLDFACEDLAVPSGYKPYLKIDFDSFKVFQTDHEASAASPAWAFQAGFQYRTDALEKLAHRGLTVACLAGRRGCESKTLGEASVDLQTVASGPERLRLALRDPVSREAQGAVRFTCVMKMISRNFTVMVEDLKLAMPGSPTPARFMVSPTLAESIVESIADPATEEAFGDQCKLTFETTLGDLLRAPDEEGLRIVVVGRDAHLGEAFIPFRRYFHPSGGREIRFCEPVTHHEDARCAQSMALGAGGTISGVLRYQNLPVYAQMAGGVYDDGRIEGGFWLFEGLPYPSCFGSAEPPVWKEDARGEPVEREGATVDLSEKDCQDLLEEVGLPPHWEKRQGRKSGRDYFLDLRTRHTTWTDPRFLPEGWEQRLDAATGKDYFADHKTQRTTYTDPRGCPNGWEMRLSRRDGEVYFVYIPTMQSTTFDPRGLPEDYGAALDEQGRMYYRDCRQHRTSWEDPRQGRREKEVTRWREEELGRWLREQLWATIERQGCTPAAG